MQRQCEHWQPSEGGGCNGQAVVGLVGLEQQGARVSEPSTALATRVSSLDRDADADLVLVSLT